MSRLQSLCSGSGLWIYYTTFSPRIGVNYFEKDPLICSYTLYSTGDTRLWQLPQSESRNWTSGSKCEPCPWQIFWKCLSVLCKYLTPSTSLILSLLLLLFFPSCYAYRKQIKWQKTLWRSCKVVCTVILNNMFYLWDDYWLVSVSHAMLLFPSSMIKAHPTYRHVIISVYDVCSVGNAVLEKRCIVWLNLLPCRCFRSPSPKTAALMRCATVI